MIPARGFAAQSKTASLTPFSFTRREPDAHDILIEIHYCGVCHSDIHQARDEWGRSVYPLVPGHEIVGTVKQIGAKVTKFKVGDIAGVGCMVGSCRNCSSCQKGLEQYCNKGFVGTYNSFEKDGKTPTYGGYSDKIVVHEDFTLKIPSNLELSRVAPLLCAGITTYSPLRHWKVGKGSKVGIVGLGGLGHMAVKLAHSMGAHVVSFTTSENKTKDAKRLGADEVVVSTRLEEFEVHANSFDFILDTVSATHDVNLYLNLLKLEGAMCLLGVPPESIVQPHSLIMKRRTLAGSLIGGIKETQEMLDYCGKHNVLPDVEMISIQQINTAYERMMKGDVKYRFVIDMQSLKYT